MKHELWQDKDGLSTFCLAGPMGDGARALVGEGAELIWTVEANSHFDGMTKYYEYMDWGEYTSEFEEDRIPYPKSWRDTQG